MQQLGHITNWRKRWKTDENAKIKFIVVADHWRPIILLMWPWPLLTFWPENLIIMFPAKIHMWPDFDDISSNSFEDVAFTWFSGSYYLLWPWPLTFQHENTINMSPCPCDVIFVKLTPIVTKIIVLTQFCGSLPAVALTFDFFTQYLTLTSTNPNTSATKIEWNSVNSLELLALTLALTVTATRAPTLARSLSAFCKFTQTRKFSAILSSSS